MNIPLASVVQTQQASRCEHEPVAVIGIGCVFPGAVGANAFWATLAQGLCAVGPVPTQRWDPTQLPASAARYAAFIEHPEYFDAGFFGISPKEAAALDPRQRLAIQVAWWALEDAAIPPDSLKGSDLGVFIGATNGEYAGSLGQVDAIEPHLGIGLSNAIIANRISHVLGSHGPSMTVDTACSASLVAVHLACRSLHSGDCNVALAGGVSLMLRPDSMVVLGKAGMLAPDGRCKSFDAAADGYGRGEGCGLVVLKRLGDALRAGDRIHAVLRGSAINHDGVSNGITAPNGLSQERLIRSALADAGLAGADIQYVEAHGTGTLLGDPTEARALGHVLGQDPTRQSALRIGSVKTNIGHLEAAAGIAGLIKLIMAIQQGALPPTLHYQKPNPHIDFKGLGLSVVPTLEAWPVCDGARTGSVSSFGFGGANAHVVVQQMLEPSVALRPPEATAAGDAAPELLVLSAASAVGLKSLASACVELFSNRSQDSWSAVTALSQTGRTHLRHRLALVAGDSAAAQRVLTDFVAGRGHADACSGLAPRRAPKIALLCPGQGAQRPGMARGLLDQDALFRATIAEADDVLGWSLTRLLREGSEDIDRTEFTQPALLAIGVGLARMLGARGVKPLALAGHSLGEYTAAVIAGGIAYADALGLVARRGQLMQGLGSGGAMAAVFASEHQVLPFLGGRVSLAAVNGENAVTISGERGDLERVTAALEGAGMRVRPLRVSTAFHSPLLDPMLDPFAEWAGRIAWQPLQIPVVSNVTGELLAVGHVYTPEYWVRHTRDPVRFADGFRALESTGVTTTIELGAVPVLTGLVNDLSANMRTLPTLSPGVDDGRALLRTIGALYTGGAEIAWPHGRAAADGDQLPAYPFAQDPYPLTLGTTGLLAGSADLHGSQALAVPSALTIPTAVVDEARPCVLDLSEVRARVVAIVAELLGIGSADVDPAAPFLELGADSLILIQAVGRIEMAFRVRIPVRAFFEDLSTIEAVCAYLIRAQVSEPVTAGATPVPVAQQSGPPSQPAAIPPASSKLVAPATALTDVQRQHLDQLIGTYVPKTRLSREHAQRFRPVMADSRGSAGFRFSIKEMLYPIVGKRAQGATVWDLDDNAYIDISMGFGVQLFGHEPEFLRDALSESLSRGLRIGPQSDAAGEVAQLITELTGVERVAFCSTGTEAVMTALRLARTATGRKRVAVFHNSYHGHFDGVLGETFDQPWSAIPRVPGITPGMVADLAVFDYGSATALEMLKTRMNEFAAVLVEPVQSRNPGLQPASFLHALRAATQAAGTILIFDEVLTGFRIQAGGAQAFFGVQADLVTYGKIVGGGLPIGVVAGRADIMAGIDGGVWQYGDASFPSAETTFFAGTFNKHPLVMAAAKSVLTEIKRGGPAVYAALNQRTDSLVRRLDRVFSDAGAPIRMSRFGSLFRFVFNDNLDPFFYHLILRGLYVWEGRNLFLSTAHTAQDVDAIVERVADSVSTLVAGGFIAARSQRISPDSAPAPASPAAPQRLPLPLAQRQLATLSAMSDEGSAAYVLSIALKLSGALDVGRLSSAFEAVVQRHDALRAGIDLQGAVQYIHANAVFALKTQCIGVADLADALRQSVAKPFDLAIPPGLRAELFELGDDQFVLLVSIHHALVDGQAMQILLGEVAATYGGESLLPVPSYKVLVDRLAQAGSRPEDDEHRAFWLQKLKSAPIGIELPFAAMRPSVRRFAGARVDCALPLPSLRQFERSAAQKGLSSSMALVAAFAASLRKAGAQRDMVLGIPYSGRDADSERTVGYCAHLLPLRLQVAAGASGDALMAEVRQQFLAAIDHSGYPMARIMDDLGIEKDPARPLLVNVTFNVDRMDALPALGGLRLEQMSLDTGFTRFDIGCNVLDWQDGARIEIDYDRDLFERSDMDRLLSDFVAMVGRLGADATAPYDERFAETERWRPCAPSLGHAIAPESLLTRFQHSVLRDPTGLAVEVDGRPCVDRQTLDHWSDRIANALGACIGPRTELPGPIALLLKRSAAMPAAMIASWKTGRAFLPIDPDLPPSRISDLLRSAAPSCVLVDPELAESLIEVTAKLESFTPLMAVPPPPLSAPSAPSHAHWENTTEDAAWMLFTSGSSGTPKLVAVPHRAAVHYLDGIIERLSLVPGMRYAMVSTFAADLGLTAVLPALLHGGCLAITSAELARDAESFAAVMRRAPVDVLKIVPSHLEALLSAQDREAVLPTQYLLLGGESASDGLLAELADIQRDCRIFNHYGPTETTIGVMIGEWDGTRLGEQARPSGPIRFQQPIGRTWIGILDADNFACGIGEIGEIVIAGPALAAYCSESTTGAGDRFVHLDLGRGVERVYRSGDLARLLGDGSIEIRGRKDDQIKIRGYRIEPSEIVAALAGDASVRSAAVVATRTEAGRPYLLAFVVPSQDSVRLDVDHLMDSLRHALPDAMVPAAIVQVASLPFTPNGKLDRAALVALHALPLAAASPDTPDSDLQVLLQSLWRSLLGRPDIGPDSNFFQSGGDSILSIQLIAKLHQAGWRAKANDLYSFPTLAAFATRVEAVTDIEDATAEGGCALLPSQLRLLALYGELPRHYNLSVRLTLAPWVTQPLLESALAALVKHHDALRLRFYREAQGWQARFETPYAPSVVAIEPNGDPHQQLSVMQASLDPEQGRMLAAAWVPGSPASSSSSVVIAVHHLVSDGVSLPILLEDLRSALLELRLTRPPHLGSKTATVHAWSDMLRRWARTDNLASEAEYWELVSSIPAPDLPHLSDPPSSDLQGDEQVEVVSLDAAETEIFLHGEHGDFTAQDVLLAAATLAIGEWTGEAQVYIELEGHGRAENSFDVDAGRTVGWFTSRFPAWFDLVDIPIANAAIAVAEQRRAIPNHGLGYGLLRYFGSDAIRSRLSNGITPHISLNYLGQANLPPNDAFSVASWAPNREDRGMERATLLARSHPLAIEAMVIDGSLSVFWQFNPRLHARVDIARVAASFIRHVAALCAPSQITAPPERASETNATEE